ncbi:MAG TPA: S9 family peptidase [Thermoanaerobaculia bacterium]
MRFWLLTLLVTTSVLAQPLTVEDYATMPQLATPRWSPDGTRIAYVVTRADLARSAYDSDVWVIDTAGTNALQLTRGSGTDARPRWSPDGTQLAFLSDRNGTPQIFAIGARGGEARALTSEPSAIREFEWSPDGATIAFTRADEPSPEEQKRIAEKNDAHVEGEGIKYVHLYALDVATGKTRRLTRGSFSIFAFSWSPDGSTIAFDRGPGSGLDDLYRTDIFLYSMRDGAIAPLVVRPGIDHLPRFSPDGKFVAFFGAGGVHDWLVEHDLYVVPATGGTPRRVSAAYDRTADNGGWLDARTVWLEGGWNTTGNLFRVNADGSGFTNVTQLEGVVSDVDTRGARAVYVRQTTTEPPELFIDGHQLTHHNDAYRNRDLGETRVIRWKNPQDGLEIEGLLTLPVGYKAGTRVPLLTFVHGGPASHHNQGFFGYLGTVYGPQVLAARGFAVLRPNPRGTASYGSKFLAANRNDWGGMDWLDVNAGIDKVIADGIADPRRLGMMGWSYGGFLAAWAIGHSDRFRALSIGAPVVDLVSMHGTTDIRDFITHYFDKSDAPPPAELNEMRHAPLSIALLREHSPVTYLRKTDAKVLIQHGEADERVPISQGRMLYRMLDELGVDVRFVTYPRTGHGTREPKLRMDLLRRNVEFFSEVIR